MPADIHKQGSITSRRKGYSTDIWIAASIFESRLAVCTGCFGWINSRPLNDCCIKISIVDKWGCSGNARHGQGRVELEGAQGADPIPTRDRKLRSVTGASAVKNASNMFGKMKT